MPETREQKVARLKREIDQAELDAKRKWEIAEAKRIKLDAMSHRPSEPEWSAMQTRIKFVGSPILYTFLILKTPVGYYTTGQGKNAQFRTWDNLLDWLDSEDIESHEGLEALVATGEMMYPQRERERYPL